MCVACPKLIKLTQLINMLTVPQLNNNDWIIDIFKNFFVITTLNLLSFKKILPDTYFTTKAISV